MQDSAGRKSRRAAAGSPRRPMHGMPSYVYAIGRVEARFPNLSPRKRNSPRRPDGRTPPERPISRPSTAVLSKRENRYLVRQLCWVLTIQGLETYLLAAARSRGHRSAGGSHPSRRQPH